MCTNVYIGDIMEKIPIHYIGQRVYSISSFINEASKYGVSRALPKGIVKGFKAGDRILLAVWKRGGGKDRKSGTAVVFGYMVVEGINVDSGVADIVKKGLNVVSYSSGGFMVERGCGSYRVTSTMTVSNSIGEIVDKVTEVEREKGVKIKVFLEGRFVPFEQFFEVADVPFSRSIVYVDVGKVPKDVVDKVFGSSDLGKKVSEIIAISGYKQDKYRPKKQRKETLTLDRFLGE